MSDAVWKLTWPAALDDAMKMCMGAVPTHIVDGELQAPAKVNPFSAAMLRAFAQCDRTGPRHSIHVSWEATTLLMTGIAESVETSKLSDGPGLTDVEPNMTRRGVLRGWLNKLWEDRALGLKTPIVDLIGELHRLRPGDVPAQLTIDLPPVLLTDRCPAKHRGGQHETYVSNRENKKWCQACGATDRFLK